MKVGTFSSPSATGSDHRDRLERLKNAAENIRTASLADMVAQAEHKSLDCSTACQECQSLEQQSTIAGSSPRSSRNASVPATPRIRSRSPISDTASPGRFSKTIQEARARLRKPLIAGDLGEMALSPLAWSVANPQVPEAIQARRIRCHEGAITPPLPANVMRSPSPALAVAAVPRIHVQKPPNAELGYSLAPRSPSPTRSLLAASSASPARSRLYKGRSTMLAQARKQLSSPVCARYGQRSAASPVPRTPSSGLLQVPVPLCLRTRANSPVRGSLELYERGRSPPCQKPAFRALKGRTSLHTPPLIGQ